MEFNVAAGIFHPFATSTSVKISYKLLVGIVLIVSSLFLFSICFVFGGMGREGGESFMKFQKKKIL